MRLRALFAITLLIAPAAPAATAQERAEAPATKPSYFTRLWELDEASRRVKFAFTPYRTTWILPYTYNGSPNSEIFSAADPARTLMKPEAAFQLSIKAKLWTARLRREGRPLARLHPEGLLAALRHRRVGALPDDGPRTGAHRQLRDPFSPAGLRRPLRPDRPEPSVQRNGQAPVAELEPSRGQRRPRARAPVAPRHRLGPRPVQAGQEREPGHHALSRSRAGPGLLLPGQAPLRDHVSGTI